MFDWIHRYFPERINKLDQCIMDEIDRIVIVKFACGEKNLREKAIEIHYIYIPLLGVRGTLEQRFMAEVDNPVPDLLLREVYRTQIQVINNGQ